MPAALPVIGPLIGAVGGIAGSALGNRSSTVKQAQNFSQDQNTAQTATTTPNLTPDLQSLMGQILGMTKGYLSSDPNLSGYQANAAEGINQGSDLNSNLIKRTLAARGLTYSPLAGSEMINNEMNRTGQLSQLGASLPLLRNQITAGKLGLGSNIFSSFPYGQTVSGTQKSNTTGQSTGSVTAPGNILGGLFTGIGGSGGMIGSILKGLGIGVGSGNSGGVI